MPYIVPVNTKIQYLAQQMGYIEQNVIESNPSAVKYYNNQKAFCNVFYERAGWAVMIYQATLLNDVCNITSGKLKQL